MFDNSILEAALKVVWLSETVLVGKSLLAVKRLEYRTKDCAVKSGTTFKCIACTMQQVYRHIHTFESFEVPGLLMYKGSSIVHTSVN